MPSIPGLNTRETALVLWVGGFLAWSLFRHEVRSALWGVSKTIASSRLLSAVILSALAWAAASAYFLGVIGSWDGEKTKVAVLWFIGVALVAVFNTRRTDIRYYRHLALHSLTLAVLVEFIANVDTFPLLIELVFVPLAFMFVATEQYASTHPEFTAARKVSGWCASTLGLVAISFSLAYVIGHFSEAVTREKVAEFLLPFLLTACFLPYLVGLRYVAVWQEMLHMMKFGMRDNAYLYRYARRSIVGACGLSLARTQEFNANYRGRLWSAQDTPDVDSVVGDFKDAWADPPPRL
jgi:hypothetical protein